MFTLMSLSIISEINCMPYIVHYKNALSVPVAIHSSHIVLVHVALIRLSFATAIKLGATPIQCDTAHFNKFVVKIHDIHYA